MQYSVRARIALRTLAFIALICLANFGLESKARATNSVTLYLPRVNTSYGNSWPYDRDNGIREIRFDVAVRTTAGSRLSERATVWTPTDGWRVGGLETNAVRFDLSALGLQPVDGSLEGRFTIDYQYGSFSVRKKFPLTINEVLLEMPFPDDVYVIGVDMRGLTWNAKNSASRLKSVLVELRSGDAVCKTIAQPEEFLNELTIPTDISCLFEWQQSLPVDPIVASIRFNLVEGTVVSWQGNGKNLRQTNPGVKLRDSDVSQAN